jgi:hypothetical protein
MKKTGQSGMGDGSMDEAAGGGFEETLKLMARLPVPEGLEERMQAALRTTPRRGRILAWPVGLRLEGGWLRAAAAAAIVVVVAGGGWGVVRHAQPGQSAGGNAVVPHLAAPGGFSTGGAMRTPQTLIGPVAPVVVAVKAQKPAAARRGKTAGTNKAVSQASTGQAK